MNNRKVAEMLKLSAKTVEVAHYRIKEKLNLGREINLQDFINRIDKMK